MTKLTPARLRAFGLAVLTAGALGLSACGGDSTTTTTSADAAPDNGDFKVEPTELTSDDYTELAEQLKTDRTMEDVAEVLNASLNMPEDIGLKFAECGEDNAYYDPEAKEITVCIDMFDAEREQFEQFYDTDEEVDAALQGSFLFTVFHEVGHALVDVLDIPITGAEEDVVDGLAAWWLIDGDGGEENAIAGALSFYTDPDEAADLDDSDFADEHSISQQRYYTLTCLVYGSDPEKYAHLLDDEWLTEDRAEQCPDEYQRLNRSWYALLDKYLKPEEA